MADRRSRQRLGPNLAPLVGGLTGVLVWLAVASSAHAVSMTIRIGEPPPVPDIVAETPIPFGNVTPFLAGTINQAILDGDPLPTPLYQQAYDSSSFPNSPMVVEKIRFFESDDQVANAALLGGNTCTGGSPPCGTATVRIGTTTTGVNNLSTTNFASNFDGGSNIVVQDVLLATLSSGGVLEFAGNPFSWNPVDGDILIEVTFGDFETVADLTQGKNSLDFDGSGLFSNPVYWSADNFDGLDNTGFGLVTEFVVNIIPEPSTFLLLGGALLALGIQCRRRPVR